MDVFEKYWIYFYWYISRILRKFVIFINVSENNHWNVMEFGICPCGNISQFLDVPGNNKKFVNVLAHYCLYLFREILLIHQYIFVYLLKYQEIFWIFQIKKKSILSRNFLYVFVNFKKILACFWKQGLLYVSGNIR